MKPLIPIYNAVINCRERRVISPMGIDGWYKQVYTGGMVPEEVRRLHVWINEFTKGRFYLGRLLVAFEDEEDFVILKLWFKDFK